jgi:hypothetical protein
MIKKRRRIARDTWTEAEDAIVLEHYESGGASICSDLLPGRTKGAISRHAYGLGLRSSRNGAAAAAVSISNQELKIVRALKPRHIAGIEAFSDLWFERCNAAFVRTMREHYPEKECNLRRLVRC